MNTRMNTFGWLLKREYWEHRGGFVWAPMIAGGVMLLIALIVLIAGEMTVRKAGFSIANMKLNELTNNMTPERLTEIGHGIDMSLFAVATPVAITLAFVLFFYLLGSLYDDRKDRSVLFWKSMPISDSETVLSKLVMATVLVPVFATVVAIASMIGFLLLISLFVSFHGINPITTIWMTASPLKVAANLVAMIPINALWAMPTIGWLMLCSAFAKRVVFLWALLVPVASGVIVSSFTVIQGMQLPTAEYWQHVVARLLFSVIPGSWIDRLEGIDGPEGLQRMLGMSAYSSILSDWHLWLGVVAGAAMIGGAIWLRRYRDET